MIHHTPANIPQLPQRNAPPTRTWQTAATSTLRLAMRVQGVLRCTQRNPKHWQHWSPPASNATPSLPCHKRPVQTGAYKAPFIYAPRHTCNANTAPCHPGNHLIHTYSHSLTAGCHQYWEQQSHKHAGTASALNSQTEDDNGRHLPQYHHAAHPSEPSTLTPPCLVLAADFCETTRS